MRPWLAAIVLTIAIGAPIVEMFDSWDPTIEQGGGDTEANAALAALCVGLGLALADVFVRCVRALFSRRTGIRALSTVRTVRVPDAFQPLLTPTGRAPTPIRI